MQVVSIYYNLSVYIPHSSDKTRLEKFVNVAEQSFTSLIVQIKRWTKEIESSNEYKFTSLIVQIKRGFSGIYIDNDWKFTSLIVQIKQIGGRAYPKDNI